MNPFWLVLILGLHLTGFLWFMDEYTGTRNSIVWAFVWPVALCLDARDNQHPVCERCGKHSKTVQARKVIISGTRLRQSATGLTSDNIKNKFCDSCAAILERASIKAHRH
jgi:hypothetical protein